MCLPRHVSGIFCSDQFQVNPYGTTPYMCLCKYFLKMLYHYYVLFPFGWSLLLCSPDAPEVMLV